MFPKSGLRGVEGGKIPNYSEIEEYFTLSDRYWRVAGKNIIKGQAEVQLEVEA